MAGYYPKAGEEVFDFLISAPTAEQILAFHPSQRTQIRLRYLLRASQNGSITSAERAELDEFNDLERMLRRLMAQTRRKMNHN